MAKKQKLFESSHKLTFGFYNTDMLVIILGFNLLITDLKLLKAIRKAFLSHPKQIVIISDGAVDISPELLLQELIAANVKQVPLHFVTPTQEYTQPKFDLIGYKSVKSQIDKVIKIQKVPEI